VVEVSLAVRTLEEKVVRLLEVAERILRKSGVFADWGYIAREFLMVWGDETEGEVRVQIVLRSGLVLSLYENRVSGETEVYVASTHMQAIKVGEV